MTEDVKKDGVPVAPPRKKRLSSVPPEQQPCGFKELFGNNVSRRTSCDSVLNDRSIGMDALQQKRLSDANLTLNAASQIEVKVPLPLPESETSAAAVAAAEAANKKSVHRLQRKVSRVGNKKSDKFFGENLSDCLSDEPVTPEPPTDAAPAKDELDRFIDAMISVQGATGVSATAMPTDSPSKDVVEDEENKTSLDRKADFLMAMLDDKNLYKDAPQNEQEAVVPPKRGHSKSASPQKSDDEPTVVAKEEVKIETEVKQERPKLQRKMEVFDDTDFYKGMTPVDEPIIVPRRKESKPHICDDEDHLHDHIHHIHRHEEKSEKMVQPKVDQDREVSIADIIDQIITPKKPKRDLTVYEKTTVATPEEIVHVETVVQSEFIPVQSQPLGKSTPAKEKPIPRTRHLSQGNLLSPKRPSTTIDLAVTATAVDIIKQKPVPDSPNQEKAEIVLKKCLSQQSFLTQELMNQIVDRVYGFKDQVDDLDSYDDGSSKVSPHSKLTTRKISVARKDPAAVPPIHENPSDEKPTESLRVGIVSAGPVAVIHTIESPPPPTISLTQSSIDFLDLERIHSNVPDKSPEQPLTPRNSVESIDAAIDPINSIETRPSVQTTLIETTTIENATPTKHILDDIYSSNRSILDGFHKYLETEKKAPSIATSESSAIGSSDEENTDSDVTVKELNPNDNLIDIEVHNTILRPLEGGERRDSIVEVDQWFHKHNGQSIGSDSRRDSSSSIGYDTRKVFPFGKSDPGAGTEFFDSQSCANKKENISSNIEQRVQDDEPIEHSTLLKYLKWIDECHKSQIALLELRRCKFVMSILSNWRIKCIYNVFSCRRNPMYLSNE